MIIQDDINKEKTITLRVLDYEGQVEELLEYLSDISTSGHSFQVVVDPHDDEYRKEFWIDGDGTDKIYIDSVEVIEDEEAED